MHYVGRFTLLVAVLFCFASPAQAERVVTTLTGVEGELRQNVRAHVSLFQAESLDNLSTWRLRQLADRARDEARAALRPFGYYSPRILVRLEPPDQPDQPWRALIDIDPGEPVRFSSVDIALHGSGAGHSAFQTWRSTQPIQVGAIVNHPTWDQSIRDLERACQQYGFFDCHFTQRGITVDPARGAATATLHLDTGPRYHFGRTQPEDGPFTPKLMSRLNILSPGQPYTEAEITRQRQVLATAGLFERFVIEEKHDPDRHLVHLDYELFARSRDSYRATVGLGTDTGTRLQLGWQRHYLSARGNRLDTGFGIQERNEEYILRSEYFHPRGDDPDEFWTAGITLRREQDSFRFNDENQREPVFESFAGPREQAEFRAGRLDQRRFQTPQIARHINQLEERIFMAVLNESFDALRPSAFTEENSALLEANPELAANLKTSGQTIALGASWRLPEIGGRGFYTEGTVINAHIMGASTTLGSDTSFLQAYIGGRWHHLLSDRHKVLLSAEIGYTETTTTTLDLRLDGQTLGLSISELPERYRFKTGGDRTVRGYGFETLSTNRNGGNHLLTFSAEYEYRIGDSWSLAAFYDIGNAFNDWDTRKLKRGVGVGFRWYTLIGPIQVDVAQALDDIDRPWRLHFTLGTRLL